MREEGGLEVHCRRRGHVVCDAGDRQWVLGGGGRLSIYI